MKPRSQTSWKLYDHLECHLCSFLLQWLINSQVDEEISKDYEMAASSGPHTGINEIPESADTNDTNQYNELDTESLDFLDEDLHTDGHVRAMGFIGKSSEVQWLRAAATAHTHRVDKTGRPYIRKDSSATENQQASSFNFWSDNESVDMDFYLDPYEMPDPEKAKLLVSIYMARVHPTFPIIDPETLEDQLREHFEAVRSGNLLRSPKCQVIPNLVFAISAKYSHVAKEDWRGDASDHIAYQARARAFGLNMDDFFKHPSLPQIQELGLLAFYWLSVGQVSR
jgi:hypothetical protein